MRVNRQIRCVKRNEHIQPDDLIVDELIDSGANCSLVSCRYPALHAAVCIALSSFWRTGEDERNVRMIHAADVSCHALTFARTFQPMATSVTCWPDQAPLFVAACQCQAGYAMAPLRGNSIGSLSLDLPAGKDDKLGEPQRDLLRRITSSSLNLYRLKIKALNGDHLCAGINIVQGPVGPLAYMDYFAPPQLAMVAEFIIHRLSSTSTLELLEHAPNISSLCIIPGKSDCVPLSPSNKLLAVAISGSLRRRRLHSLAIYPVSESPGHINPGLSSIARSMLSLRCLDMHICTPSVIDSVLSTGVVAGLTYLNLYGSAPWEDGGCQAANNFNPWGTRMCPYAAYSGQAPRRKEDRQHLRRLLAACSSLRHLTLAYFIGADLALVLDALKKSGARLSTLSLAMHECRGRTGSEAAVLALQSPTHPVLTRLKVLAVKGQSSQLKEVAREMRVKLAPPRELWDWWPRWQ